MDYILDYIPSDFVPHVLSDVDRKMVMEARPNTRFRDFIGQGPQIGPAVGYSRCGEAGHREFRHISRAEDSFPHVGDRARHDTVGARIFRMHRRVVDRLPGSIPLDLGIPVEIAVTDSGDRTPEIV